MLSLLPTDHGWPRNWRAFDRLSDLAGEDHDAMAREFEKPIIVGHEVGEQISFFQLRRRTEVISKRARRDAPRAVLRI